MKKNYLNTITSETVIFISANIFIFIALFLIYKYILHDKINSVFAILFLLAYITLESIIVINFINFYNKKISGRLIEAIPEDKNQVKNKNLTFKEVEQQIGTWASSKKHEISLLQDKENYRKEFLGNVSHELKTPIFIAQSYIETLIDGSIFDNKVNLKHLNKAKKSILRLSQIVNDLEMISKLERNEQILSKRIFDINTLIRETVDSLEFSAKSENIEIKVNLPKNTKIKVYADEQKIAQVLTNLLVNALKYCGENGKISINCSKEENKYRIEVCDNGIGISPENIDRIFERFYRIDKDRSRKKGGTGLGLSIVKHIIEAHDELITVTSEPNKGSKFSFTLSSAENA